MRRILDKCEGFVAMDVVAALVIAFVAVLVYKVFFAG